MNFEATAKVTATVLGFIFLNGFCDNVLSDYLWARAVVLTSPTVATLGMSITIPLAIISDVCLGKSTFSPMSLIGAILVITGFTLVNVDDEIWRKVLLYFGFKNTKILKKSILAPRGAINASLETE